MSATPQRLHKTIETFLDCMHTRTGFGSPFPPEIKNAMARLLMLESAKGLPPLSNKSWEILRVYASLQALRATMEQVDPARVVQALMDAFVICAVRDRMDG